MEARVTSAGTDGPARAPHVLLVTGTLEGGGAERIMSDMANYWSARGWRVQLATWTGPAVADFYTLSSAVERVWLDVAARGHGPLATMRSNLARVVKLRRLLKRQRPDAVLSFIDVPNVLTILAASGLGIRVVVSERSEFIPGDAAGAYRLARPWRLLRRLVYRWAERVTALNGEAARRVSEECSVEVEVIPNPLRDLPFITREREALVLGFGRLGSEKGFDVLLRAFDAVAGEFPAWRLVLLGRGPEAGALRSLRQTLSARERIEINDPVTGVEEWIARAGLVVLPSRFEAFGNAILESLGMGSAVISTECSGPRSFVTDGINGRLVPIGDVAALAAAMRQLMSDPSARERLGREAAKVRESHRQALIMRKWERCLFPDREQSAPTVQPNLIHTDRDV